MDHHHHHHHHHHHRATRPAWLAFGVRNWPRRRVSCYVCMEIRCSRAAWWDSPGGTHLGGPPGLTRWGDEPPWSMTLCFFGVIPGFIAKKNLVTFEFFFGMNVVGCFLKKIESSHIIPQLDWWFSRLQLGWFLDLWLMLFGHASGTSRASWFLPGSEWSQIIQWPGMGLKI